MQPFEVEDIVAENEATFTIRGIDSESDAHRIESTLDDLDGVMGVTIDHESGHADVHYDVDILAEERVKITVRDLGYDVE